MKNNINKYGNGSSYSGARPMKAVIDEHGNEWLCDDNVNTVMDYAGQGCWRTDEMAFNRND
ncbi:MAG: hypothetical protein GF307_07050 [candidate division Zixibacteria bacterium]|nr:hypothetical protein [candidate division Zixibacteria bacterium]